MNVVLLVADVIARVMVIGHNKVGRKQFFLPILPRNSRH